MNYSLFLDNESPNNQMFFFDPIFFPENLEDVVSIIYKHGKPNSVYFGDSFMNGDKMTHAVNLLIELNRFPNKWFAKSTNKEVNILLKYLFDSQNKYPIPSIFYYQ